MTESQTSDCVFSQQQQRTKRQFKKLKQKTKVSPEEKARIAEEARVAKQALRETLYKPVKEAAGRAAASTEKRPRLIGLVGQIFHLYSTDHVKHVPGPLEWTEKIDFHDNRGSEDPLMPVDGWIDIRMDNVCNLDITHYIGKRK